ncbi:hypothetical protein PFISCL1PPCAC_17733, partial [Pristionchus fissidentatus]
LFSLLMRVVFALLAVVALVATRSLKSDGEELSAAAKNHKCNKLILSYYWDASKLSPDELAFVEECKQEKKRKSGKLEGQVREADARRLKVTSKKSESEELSAEAKNYKCNKLIVDYYWDASELSPEELAFVEACKKEKKRKSGKVSGTVREAQVVRGKETSKLAKATSAASKVFVEAMKEEATTEVENKKELSKEEVEALIDNQHNGGSAEYSRWSECICSDYDIPCCFADVFSSIRDWFG